MALVTEAVMEIFRQPTIGGVVSGLALLSVPLSLAAFVGLLIGWAWNPKWASGIVAGCSQTSGFNFNSPNWDFSSFKKQISCSRRSSSDDGDDSKKLMAVTNMRRLIHSSMAFESGNLAVTSADLKYLCELVEGTDGGLPWHLMMDKVLPSFSYRAWRRDPVNGPTEYHSRTVFENATPEIVRDFFWDDEFRMKNKWDDMLIHYAILEECGRTGTTVAHWIRKFPFFCSDREYTIGRRIWKCGQTYYCLTKGIPCPSIARKNKPRRVDRYFSSWCIRPVESRSRGGQMTASEVLLFHHEDMGIPREIAKLGVRQGMWGCVKKIEPGLRAYQKERSCNVPLSQTAKIAQVNTEIEPSYLRSLETSSEASDLIEEGAKEKTWGRVPKLLMVGGAVAIACSLDRGLLTKAIIFGVARKFMKQGRRL